MSSLGYVSLNNNNNRANIVDPVKVLDQEIVHSTTCSNCETSFEGQFCPRCGQRHRAERLSLKMLLIDMPAQWLNLDKGFFYTFLQHFKSPGSVARLHVKGQRVIFTNPLTYYLIGTATQLLMLFVFGHVITEKMIAQMQQTPETVAGLQAALGDNALEKYADLYLSVINQGYTYLGILFFCIPFALYLRLFSKKHRQAYNTAETLVFAFYTMGHFIMCTGLLGFISMTTNPDFHAPVSFALCLVFGWLSCRGFYEKAHHSGVASFFALLLTFATFLLSLVIALGIAIKIQ